MKAPLTPASPTEPMCEDYTCGNTAVDSWQIIGKVQKQDLRANTDVLLCGFWLVKCL